MTLAAGSKLGPYEILGQIGAGGMGEVYRAKDPRVGREVAVEDVQITRDGKTYAYSLNRVTNSDLYVMTGSE